jgi:hypothetical protein
LFKRGWWLWLLAWPSLFILIPLPFIYGAFKALEWRWWLNGIRIGEVRFESSLSRGALIGLYWKVIGWSMMLSFLLGLWGGAVWAIASSLGGASGTSAQRMLMIWQQIPVLIAIGIGYVTFALAIGAIRRIYLIRDLWQRVAETVTVQNLAAADNVAAQGNLVSALGEGFADSLDVVGF